MTNSVSYGFELEERMREKDRYRAPHQHPDDAAVDRFAKAMKAKLAQKRAEGRGGWGDKADCSQQRLSDMLRNHVEKGDPVDVANFAMMLHQRGERIIAPYAVKEERLPEFRRKLLKVLPPLSSDEEYNSVFDAIMTAACEEVAK